MQTPARALTLSGVLVPGTGILRDGLLVVGFSLFTALSAQISLPLPFTPVPITGQTLAVLLTGAVLGSRRGTLALLAYLAEGLAGLPVFASGNNAWSPTRVGVPYILGPTAGYLLGCLLAALVVGFLAERGWDRTLWKTAGAMVLGEVAIYAVGLPWLALYVGMAAVVPLGLVPFIPGDLIKLALASGALPGAWALVQGRDRAAGEGKATAD